MADKFIPQSQGNKYNLGNNVTTSSSDQAIELFLWRELEAVHLLVEKGAHHNALFIPDAYLFKGLAEKVGAKRAEL